MNIKTYLIIPFLLGFLLQTIASDTDSLYVQLEEASPVEAFSVHYELAKELVSKYPDSSLYHAKQMHDLILSENLNDSLPKYYNAVGICFWHKMDYDTAYTYFDQALSLAMSQEDDKQTARSYHNLGLLKKQLSQPIEAIQYFRKAQQYAKSEGTIAKIRLDLGGCYTMKNNADSALLHFAKASEYFEEKQNADELIFLYNSLGNLYMSLNEYQKARSYYFKCLEMDLQSDNTNILYSIYNNLGRYYESTAYALDSAIYYYEASLEAIDYNLKHDSYLSTNINIGIIYYMKGDFEKAISYNRKVLAIPGIEDFALEHASVLANMGIYNIPLNRPDSVLHYFKLALPIAQKNDFLTVQKNIYDNEAYLWISMNDFEKTLQTHLLSDSIAAILSNQAKEREIAHLEAKMRKDATTRENVLLKKQNELDQEIIAKNKMLNIGFALFIIFLVIVIIIVLRSSKRLKVLNQQMHQKNNELQSLNLTKDKLFSIVSHDLRGPVGSTHNLLKVLKENYDQLDTDKVKDRINALEVNSRNVYRQVSNLLDWTKIQRDSIQASIQEVNIKVLFEELKAQLSSSAKRKEIELQFESAFTDTIKTDPNILKAIISNLVYNSIKFSNVGSHIDVRMYYCKDHKLCISVQDYGIGIPQDLAEKLFLINGNSHRLGTQNEQGTGLGLIIVKELSEVLNGTIEVNSEEGVGTKVTVFFPL
jgi:signal transduction histidine kinase/Tfp pilus assembly protein PilF